MKLTFLSRIPFDRFVQAAQTILFPVQPTARVGQMKTMLLEALPKSLRAPGELNDLILMWESSPDYNGLVTKFKEWDIKAQDMVIRPNKFRVEIKPLTRLPKLTTVLDFPAEVSLDCTVGDLHEHPVQLALEHNPDKVNFVTMLQTLLTLQKELELTGETGVRIHCAGRNLNTTGCTCLASAVAYFAFQWHTSCQFGLPE